MSNHKHLLAFIFLTMTTLFVSGQRKYSIENAKTYEIKATSSTSSIKLTIPFKEIIVKDYRFDTTKLGYLGHTHFYKIVLKDSAFLSAQLNRFYKNNLSATSERSLVINIKTLWFQKRGAHEKENNKVFTMYSGALAYDGVCIAELEAFAVTNGTYQAVSKIEAPFYTTRYNRNKLEDLLFAPFDSLLSKIGKTNIDSSLAGKRRFTESDIHTNYITRFNLPVLKGLPEKGVFLSFDDFRYNRTVHSDYIVRQSKLSTEVYIANNGKEQLLDNYWGLYDGKDFYIRLGFSLFRLTRQNNSFDLVGSKYVTHVKSNWNYEGSSILQAIGEANISNRIHKTPLQINMENGEVY